VRLSRATHRRIVASSHSSARIRSNAIDVDGTPRDRRVAIEGSVCVRRILAQSRVEFEGIFAHLS